MPGRDNPEDVKMVVTFLRLLRGWTQAELANLLWEAGAPGDPGLLEEARMLDLEAALNTAIS